MQAELMRSRVRALFTLTAEDKLARTRDVPPSVAPRFYLGRCATGHVWHVRNDMPDTTVRELEKLCRAEPSGPVQPKEPVFAAQYRAVLAEQAPISNEWSGPCFTLGVPLAAAASTPGQTVAIDAANAELLRAAWPAWIERARTGVPFVAALAREHTADDVPSPVSVCASVRVTDAAHECGVETSASHRRRGHALRAVAHWAALVQRAGATAFYSTAWQNEASQTVAARLGATYIGSDFHLT